MLVSIDRSRPLAEQIYRRLRGDILAGRLRPGVKLPSSRALARELSVSRNTVLATYEHLAAEGYVEGAGARGTRVSGVSGERLKRSRERRSAGQRQRGRPAGKLSADAKRLRREPGIFAPLTLEKPAGLRWDFDYNVNMSDPTSRRAWGKLLRRRAAVHEATVARLDFRRDPGRLHEAIARHLRSTRGVQCAPEQVLVVPSSQVAIQWAAWLLVDPGEPVALEDPHYVGARTTFRGAGARLAPVPADDQGLRPEKLPRGGARLLYIAPSHHWPTGAVLPFARRIEILSWASRHRAWVFENDHNCGYRHEGPALESLQGLDPSRVLHTGSFHWLLSPESTIAYLVVPPALVETFRAAQSLAAGRPSLLEAEVLTAMLETGEIERLVRRVVRRLSGLRASLGGALEKAVGPEAVVRAPASGLHFHVSFPGRTTGEVDGWVAAAAAAGVGVYPDRPFHLRPARAPGLLFGVGKMGADDLREGVERFGEVVPGRDSSG